MIMKCNICDFATSIAFTEKVLNKYSVKYYQCERCGFIQTEDSFWLDEAYESPITSLDIGLLSRNVSLSSILAPIIDSNFNHRGKFLDYAGGYGILTRLMRDNGYDYYHIDKYCQNIFAKDFELKDSSSSEFELITAFEFFEHIHNPTKEIVSLLELSDKILFSTELIPTINNLNSKNWDYIAPETGQHISFYTTKSLLELAKKLNLHYYNSGNLHLLSKASFLNNPLDIVGEIKPKVSLTPSDYQILKKKMVSTPSSIKNYRRNKTDSLQFDKQRRTAVIGHIRQLIEKNNDHKRLIKDLSNRLKMSESRRVDLEHNLIKVENTKLWKAAELVRSVIFRAYKIKISVEDLLLQSLSKGFPETPDRKTLLLIDHNYHKKTKSFDFLAEYLKEYFNVIHLFVKDDNYDNEVEKILSDLNYDIVWFHQILPSRNLPEKIKEKTVLSVMFDGHGHNDIEYWKQYRGLKFVNFSKELHYKHRLAGCRSLYLQYYPEPKRVDTNDNSKAFFWQRVDAISLKTVVKLLPKQILLHVHWAPDPKQISDKSDLKVYQKRISSITKWDKMGKSYRESLNDCGIYISPRPSEGIGHSFLEALSMGKAIIAVDNPTMNEYLKNNITGYLYDLNNPKMIDLTNIESVQRNAYKLVVDGRKKWLRSRERLLSYIIK